MPGAFARPPTLTRCEATLSSSSDRSGWSATPPVTSMSPLGSDVAVGHARAAASWPAPIQLAARSEPDKPRFGKLSASRPEAPLLRHPPANAGLGPKLAGSIGLRL